MIEITNLTMNGSAQLYTVPDNTHSLAVAAVGGDIDMSTAADGDVWTIKDGEKESINAGTVSAEKIYFNGTSGVVVQIRRLTGLLS